YGEVGRAPRCARRASKEEKCSTDFRVADAALVQSWQVNASVIETVDEDHHAEIERQSYSEVFLNHHAPDAPTEGGQEDRYKEPLQLQKRKQIVTHGTGLLALPSASVHVPVRQ